MFGNCRCSPVWCLSKLAPLLILKSSTTTSQQGQVATKRHTPSTGKSREKGIYAYISRLFLILVRHGKWTRELVLRWEYCCT